MPGNHSMDSKKTKYFKKVMRSTSSFFQWFLSLLLVAGSVSASATDPGFLQPVSVKYKIAPNLKPERLKKLVVDYNNNVFVLTDIGLFKTYQDQLIQTNLYRPLANKIPLDIAIQEKTGYLYYLYDTHFLTNEETGIPFGEFAEGSYQQLAINSAGNVLLVGKDGAAIFKNKKLQKIKPPSEPILEIKADKGNFYALGANAVYQVDGEGFRVLHSSRQLTAFAIGKDEIFLGTFQGYYSINKTDGAKRIPLQQKLPVPQITALSFSGNQLWAGSSQGAFTKNPQGGFRYFASHRWLDNDQVTSISADTKGNIYLLTPSGLNQIQFITTTYFAKSKFFEDKIRERHIRYGLLAELRMKTPGDLTTAEMVDTDNDGLWTSFYVAALALKHAVTGDALAKRHAWESFAAYERLISINQVPGLPSRTYERRGYKVSDPEAWRASPDSGWEWKGTTSSDEFVGHIFAAAFMDQFVAKEAHEKKRVAAFIEKILDHIIRHNYNFVDLDGEPTLWGRWHPDYVNWYAKTISDRKLASTDLIAGLQLGYALTKKEIYKQEADRLMKEHGYLENIMISPYNIKATPNFIYKGIDMGAGPWNHSDDEMEFLSYWVLFHYAFSKELKQQYAKAINEFLKIEAPEKHPAWNLITLGTAGNFDKESTLWYLREFPMDLIRWDVKNSHRKDLTFLEPNFRNQFTDKVLSPAERAVTRFNANEFNLYGGSGGRAELTGVEYVFCYWMARYLNVLK